MSMNEQFIGCFIEINIWKYALFFCCIEEKFLRYWDHETSHQSQIYDFIYDYRVERLGQHGVDEIMSHRFFKNETWSWTTIRTSECQLLINICECSFFDSDKGGHRK